MEGKILVTLLIFLVFLLYVKSTSTYTTSDAGADWHSQYQNIGMDIDPVAYGSGNLYPVTADQGLSQDQINYKMWVNFASIDPSLTAPAGSKPIWGFRKQLQIGGNGTVQYLVTDPTGTGGGTNYQTVKAVAIDTTVFNTVTYVIPNYIIVKRSLISPVITCDPNATAGGALDINGQPQSCTCNAGYYGNGASCAACPAGYYCPGGANAPGCATNVPVPGASPATTRNQTSAPLSTTSSACYLPCAVGATSSTATTTSGATCSCQFGNWGTGFACNLCGVGTYSAAGTTGAAGVVTKCPDCAPGTVQPNTGQASCNNCPKNQYSNAPTRTSCSNCAAGTYSLAASADSCSMCSSGYSSLAGQDCAPFATSAALQGYLSSNSPCQGTWNVTTPAVCPTTCPYAGGTIPGVVNTWSTSIAATGTGTCPQAAQGTTTASPVSCPANNCNAVGSYNMTTPASSCPTTCGYAGGTVAGAVYTWSTSTAATGTGATPPATSTAASLSCVAQSACPATTLINALPATGFGYTVPPPVAAAVATWPTGLGTITYNTSTGIYTWVPLYTRSYNLVIGGACGGTSRPSKGAGAVLTGTYTFTQSVNYYFVIGSVGGGMGQGGGSFIFGTSVTVANCLFAAGGAGYYANASLLTTGASTTGQTGGASGGAGGGLGLTYMVTNGFSGIGGGGFGGGGDGVFGSGGGYSGGSYTAATAVNGGGGSWAPAGWTGTAASSTRSDGMGFITIS